MTKAVFLNSVSGESVHSEQIDAIRVVPESRATGYDSMDSLRELSRAAGSPLRNRYQRTDALYCHSIHKKNAKRKKKEIDKMCHTSEVVFARSLSRVDSAIRISLSRAVILCRSAFTL